MKSQTLLKILKPKNVIRIFSIAFLIVASLSCNQTEKTKVENPNAAPATVGIEFVSGSWSDVLAEAKKQNKYIFLDTYAEWCSPCKWMAKNIFVKKNVGVFYNDKFISYRMDMEKGEGVELYEKFGLTGYPSFLFFKPDGEIIHHSQGSEDTEERFIQLGKDVFDENKALFSLKAKYEAGNREPGVTVKYLVGLKKAYLFMDKYRPLIDTYVNSQAQPLPINAENWLFINELVTDISHPFYLDLLKREASYTNEFGLDATKRAIYLTKMEYFAGKKNWKNYSKSVVDYLDSGAIVDNEILVKMSWTVVDNVSDRKTVLKVSAAMHNVAQTSPTYSHLQAYAQLLAKSGNNIRALEQARLAIEKGNESGEDVAGMEKLINSIE